MNELNNIEIKIIRLMADGVTQRRMAKALGYPEHTIETYRYRLFNKIKVKNAPHCIAWAFRNKILN